jgi:phosphate-selective porin OprO/OprP
MNRRRPSAALVLVLSSAPVAHAQTPGTPPSRSMTAVAGAQRAPGAEKRPSRYDEIWQRFTQWYRNDRNPVVQRVLFTGRYQHEFARLDSDQGDHDEWNVRRMRLGPRVTLFRHFLVHAEIEVNPQERDPFYIRFTDMYVQWNKRSDLVVTIGKQGIPFTQEGATSSRELITIDRSNLANNIWFPQEYMPGVSVSGRIAPWVYRVGVYSSGRMNRELGDFEGGGFGLVSGGYDFAKTLGVKEALLSGNYIYQPPDAENTFTRQLEHIGSVNLKFEADRWGARADYSAAAGYLGQSDLWSVMAMPFVNVTGKLQLVARFTTLRSENPRGVRLATYESRLASGRGDAYDEWYGGANYYFYGHRLKLQTGVHSATLTDRDTDVYSGVSWTTGVRIGW